MCCFWNNDSEQLAWLPGPHGFLFNLIKPLQPMFAILGGVLEQKERGSGHVVSNVAEMPFASAPERTKISGLFFWIVAFARAQLFKLHCDRSRYFARGSLRKNAHTAVIVRVGARRRPGVVGRIRGDALETFSAHVRCDVVTEFGIAFDDLL